VQVYVTQVVGGHDIGFDLWTSAQELLERGDFTREQIEEAERDGECYADSDSIHVVDLGDLWSVVGTWQDPEPGVAVYGPFPTEQIAGESLAQVATDFGAAQGIVADEEDRNIFDLLPEDIKLEVLQMSKPSSS
jgi:hypothetical protein